MNENNQLKAFIAFLFIFVVMALSQTVHAAAVLTPSVMGISMGSYSATAGSFSTAANGSSYGASGIVSVGGKAITVPATLRMAANAGNYVKNAMRLNPTALIGTIAFTWLLTEGLEYANNEWGVRTTSETLSPCFHPGNGEGYCYLIGWANIVEQSQLDACTGAGGIAFGKFENGANYLYCWFASSSPLRTATQNDWDQLPDPLPALAPELPHAPYMPDGVPVEDPEYDFVPFDVPLGSPYTKPDGSTVQPKAKVSPNGDAVTVDTYDAPLTDANGDPVPSSTPEDTPEPTQSECEKHPNTIGCSEYGTPPAPETIGSLTVPVNPNYSPIGGVGSCPADVTTSAFGLTFSYQPICDFASAIKPFVLGFAWLSFAFIVAGTVRT